MGKLGNQYYEINFKDNTDAGIKSIENKIRKLNATIKPKILLKDVRDALSGLNGKKGLNINVGINADASKISTSIKSILSSKDFLAKINADTKSFHNDIQSAINSGSYVAKITADTTSISSAIQSVVSKPIKVTAVVETKQTNNNSTTHSSSSTNKTTQEQRKAEAEIKKYHSQISRGDQTLWNIWNLRKQYFGASSKNLTSAREQVKSIMADIKSSMSSLGNVPFEKYLALADAIRNAQQQMKLFSQEQRKALQDSKIAASKALQDSKIAASARKMFDAKRFRGESTLWNIDNLISRHGGKSSANLDSARSRVESAISDIKSSMSSLGHVPYEKYQALAEAIRNAQQQMKSFSQEQRKALQDSKNLSTYASSLNRIASEMQNVGNKGGWLREQISNIFSLYMAQGFLNNLINIGGEFEKQKLALNAILGSMDRANTIYTNIKNLAVESPFGFGELTKYTKQLVSYGLEYNTSFDTTKRLADISAGVGVDMSRIILAYGQVFTAHFLRGQELRQFTEAGIPLVDALAKRFSKLRGETVSAGDVFSMISEKAVKFEDVKAVLEEMTNEGGRFYKMQETLSESLSGKWSNFKDQIEIMYSEIENATQGLLKGGVSFLTEIVKQWKTIGAIGVGVLTFLALFSAKKRIYNVLTNANRNFMSSALRASNATQAALERESALYSEIIAKIKERERLIAESSPNQSLIIRRNAGITDGAAYMNRSERQALLLQNAKIGFLGGNPRTIKEANKELIRAAGKLSVIDKYLFGLNRKAMSVANSSSLWSKMFFRAQLGLTGLGLSIGQFAKTMFTGVNGVFLAISIAIGYISMKFREAEEYNQNLKDSMEGAKQAYEEFSKFVKENPIEVAINTKDDREIDKLISKYKEEISNAPIDLNWVISSADGLTDKVERLKLYKKAIDEAAEAEKQFLNGESFKIGHEAMNETDEWFWGSDNLSDNLKDMIEGFRGLSKSLNEIDPKELDETFDKIYKKYPQYRRYIDDYRNGLLSLDAIVMKLYRENHISEYFGTFQKWAKKMNYGGTFSKSVLTKMMDFKKDIDDFYKYLERYAKNNPSLGINFNAMTDAAYIKFQKIMKDVSTEQQWSEEQSQMIIADLTSRMKPSKDATWSYNVGLYKEALDEILEYSSEFEGKSKEQIEKGLADGSKSGMRKALENAKAELIAKKPWLQAEIQKVFDSMVFHIMVERHFTDDYKVRTVYQKDFSNFVDRKLGKSKGLPNPDEALYEAAGPQNDESFHETSKRLQEQEENQREIVKEQQRYYNAHKTNGKELEDAKNKLKITQESMDFLGIPRKKDKDTEAAKRAQEKAKREREKKLHAYERSLQNEFNQLKKVKDLFEKLRNLYGDIGALNKIRESGLVASKYIPQNVSTRDEFIEGYKKLLKSLNSRINGKTDTLKNLKDNISSDIFNLGYERDKDDLDKQVQILETELQRAGDAWDRYIKLVEDGLNKTTAGVMAFGSYNGETDKSLLKEQLAYRANAYIENKSNKSISSDELENILSMNEAELNVHFGDNAEITKGLWKIVEAYQNVAKEIRSENDKLIADLYKDSLSYAEKLDNISSKAKQDRATIREKANKYEDAKHRYDNAVSTAKSLEEQINTERELLNSSKEGMNYFSTREKVDTSKKALDAFNESLNGRKLNKKQKEEKQRLEADYGNNNRAFIAAEKAYTQSPHYKKAEALSEKNNQANKDVSNAKILLGNTLAPNIANRLLAQIDKKEKSEKGSVLNEMFTKRADYSRLFTDIYSMTSEAARKIAETLITKLDESLKNGTITPEEYNKKRSEIDEQKNKALENRKNLSVFLNGIGGITKFRYDQANGKKELAAKNMERIQGLIDNVDNNKYLSPEAKESAKKNYKEDYDKYQKEYNDAEKEGDKQKKKEAKQGMAGSVIGRVASMSDSMAQFRDTLGSTISSLGVDTENNAGWQTFSTAVDVMSDIGSGMQNAFQSIMSGDFFGAAISIISTPLNIITAFNKLHDKKLDIQIEQSKKRSKEIKSAADQIASVIEDNLGTENAKERVLNSYGLLSTQLDEVAKGRNGAKKLGNIYSEPFKILSGQKSLLDLVDSYDDSYRAKEERQALLDSGISLGSKNFLDLVEQRNSVSRQLEQSRLNDINSYRSSDKSSSNKRQYTESEQTKELSNKLSELNKQIATEKSNSSNNVSVYGVQYLALLEQRKELEKQMSLENDKKNADPEKLKDYRDQLVDLNNQIRNFAKNLAKELYGIDLSSWASKMGDSIVTAFENGEDAAQSFKKSVNEIMKELAKNMVIQDIIKPEISNLEKELFGEEGKTNGVLSDVNNPSEAMKKAVPIIYEYIDGLSNKIPVVNALLEAINKATDGAITADSGTSSSSITKSEQSLTEETGNLLASYVNALRADVSISRGYLQDLIESSLPQMNAVAEAQLKQLNSIVTQTKLIEANTRANAATAETIRKSLDSVITTASGGKAIRLKV